MRLTTKILLGLFIGAVVGLILNITSQDLYTNLNTWLFEPLGTVFLNLINMLVVPIVFFSLTLGTAGLGDPKKLGRIGGKTISFFLVSTTIALLIGLSLAFLIQPGAGGNYDTEQAEFQAAEAPPILDTLLDIVPTNPIQAMADANMLQIIVFSIFIGLGLAVLGEKTEGILKLVDQGNEIMMYLVGLIMLFAPYGTFGLIATAVGSQGLSAIRNMGMYMIVVALALFIHAFVTYGTAVKILGKMNPLKFFKEFIPAMTVAFSTSSSSATLPVSMKIAQNNLKVPERISSFVQPLGATINMDGTGIMQGVATVFIAQAYGLDLSVVDIVTVVLTAVLASIGTAGVPGVGLILLAMVLSSVGLPPEGIGLIIGIDRLLDMTRTAVNITGDAACAVVVAESERRMEKSLK